MATGTPVSAEIIEAPLLRVPQEALKRAAKDRKGLIDEASEALAALGPLSDAATSQDEQVAGLDQLVTRLQGLKRKLADVSRAERDEAARCQARLEHLAALGAPARGAAVAWNRPRLDRILVDHLLRDGCHVSATALSASAGIDQLCDLHVFGGARAAADALRARDAAPALAWCAEQRARLRKAKSPLEFKLRLQEFVELLRKKGKEEVLP
ncbi:Protein fyv10 [Monoraphidium neglectum]|uniref:Protein fyv10 n=1 Tax=Monoraphidium neglectum TaxID=145388 RepID=A0A0D2K7D1_9CHLO|nr:Protein fyv10 [Monoraphidium neglectum]KIY92088.1 Protein fyv10 [Monoraphidium neglectum]|eukprot:XP_013891108.1 Protein fyv10 [Monoraphidium neglectum]